ncbi:MAG: hypothetical protein Q9M21_02370 [Mariprofundaceae bacterium]|nr:hypothetical protein [Mariprofundaceae bacterium]
MKKTYKALQAVYINHQELSAGDTIVLHECAAQFHIADGTLQEVAQKQAAKSAQKGA